MTILRDLFGPGTWGVSGNLIAAAIGVLVGGAAAWLGRHKIGRALAAWWNRHHARHAIEQHKQALREHEAEQRQREDGSA